MSSSALGYRGPMVDGRADKGMAPNSATPLQLQQTGVKGGTKVAHRVTALNQGRAEQGEVGVTARRHQHEGMLGRLAEVRHRR